MTRRKEKYSITKLQKFSIKKKKKNPGRLALKNQVSIQVCYTILPMLFTHKKKKILTVQHAQIHI